MFSGLPDPHPDPLFRDTDPNPYLQAKIVRKTLIPTVLCLLYDFLYMKKYVNVPSKSNMQKNIFFLKVTDEKSRIRIRIH
jgi:hypothetical protein